MKRLREFFERIAFAGLKPSGQPGHKPQFRWLGPLGGPIERLLSGGPAPSDPLYLTNRTLGQKLRSWSMVAIPCGVLALAIGVMMSNFFDPPEAKPVKEATPAEIAAKLLPNVDREAKLAPPAEVQVLEVHVEGSRVVGTLQNNTTREIATVDMVLDLTDSSGSQLGAVNGSVEKLAPSGRKDFQIPIKQREAAVALVREVTAR